MNNFNLKYNQMMRVNIDRSLIFRFIMLFLIAISFSIRIIYVDSQPYWVDESYTRWFAEQTYKDLLFWVPTFESHPPFYYILAKSWNYAFGGVIENSERYLSLALSAVLFITAYLTLHNKYTKNNDFTLLFITIFLCFDNFLSWYSIEGRPYLLLTVSFSIAILGFVQLNTNRESSGHWSIFVLGCVMTNWSHNLGSLLSLGLILTLAFHFLFVVKSIQKLKALIWSSLTIFVLCIPLLFMIIEQLQGWSRSTWVPEASFITLLSSIINLFTFILPDSQVPKDYPLIKFTNIVITFCLLGYFFITSILSKDYTRIYLAVNTGFVIIISFIITVTGPNIFIERTFVPTLIPFYLFVALSLSRLNNLSVKIVGMVILVVSTSYSSVQEFRTVGKEPWDVIISHIYEHSGSGTKVLVLPNSVELAIIKNDFQHELTDKLIALPFKYPAIDKSSFYPSGTPSVPGFAKENLEGLSKIIDTQVMNLILVVKGEDLFDPNTMIRQSITQKGWDETLIYEWKYIVVYEYSRNNHPL